MRQMMKTMTILAASSATALSLIATDAVTSSAMAKTSRYAGKTIKVVFQDYGGGHQEQIWLSAVKSQFLKLYPGVNVQLEPINASENDYYTKLDLMNQSARTAPDVMVEDTFLVNSDASAGYLMSMNKYVKAWPDWSKEFYPAMQAAAESSNGTVYGVPFNTDTRGIYYDKPLFKRLGLPVPWQPHTWADVLKVARVIKAKAPGVTPLWFFSGKAEGEASTMQGLEMLLYGTKSPLYDFKTGKWVTKSSGLLDSLKFVQTIFQQHLAESLQDALTPQSAIIATQQRMPQQKVGMLIDGDWEYSAWLPTGAHPWKQWHDVYDITKMPNEFGHGYTSLSGGWTLSISSKSQQPSLAWNFIKQATNRPNMLNVDLISSNITPRKDVAASPQYKQAGQGMLTKFSAFNAFTKFRPANAQYPAVSNQIQAAMENVMTGSMSPADAMNQFAQQVANLVGSNKVESMK